MLLLLQLPLLQLLLTRVIKTNFALGRSVGGFHGLWLTGSIWQRQGLNLWPARHELQLSRGFRLEFGAWSLQSAVRSCLWVFS